MSNVLNNLESATIITLQFIKIKLLEEKTRIQRKGSALEEPQIEDEPREGDFGLGENVIKGTVTFDQLISKFLNAPSTPIENLVKEVGKLKSISTETSLDKQKESPKAPAQWWAKFNAWLVARSVWKVRKSELDFEYERTKADIVKMCYGIDFAINLIDKEIERQQSGKQYKVSNDYD